MPAKVLKRGDIVLVPFPFTDQSGAKVRPAVIVSAYPKGPDVIIAFISSIIPAAKPEPSDLIVRPDDQGFAGTGLRRASVFKMSKLTTLDRSLILRRLGKITPVLQSGIDQCLKAALGLT
jgi:mRNA interferase MazF